MMKIPHLLIQQHVELALAEIGEITPVYNPEVEAWLFQHPAYDLEAEGETSDDCMATYKRWLHTFIKERLKNNLAPNVEAKSSGRGGKRDGAGRPIGTKKTDKMRIYVPQELAFWLKDEKNIQWLQSQISHS